MKKKIINISIIISCIFVIIEILLNKTLIFDTISYSIEIWLKSIIPSLFPFFVISDILINYNITNYIPKFIKNVCKKLFNISDNAVIIFFLSLISGFPSNARNTRIMYDKKKISKEEASHILTFTHFSNPLFILGTLVIFFGDEKISIIIFLAHYLSNIIIGIFIKKHNTITNIDYNITNNISQSFPKIFITAIKNAIDNLLTILGTVTCFLVISSIIINRINLNIYNSVLIKGILEITMGLEGLSLLNLSILYKVVIASMFISFGGLSIHMQVLSFLIDTDIKYKYYFIARIYQSLISGILSYIFYMIIY